MSKVVNGVVGIDVSNRDLESSVLNNVLKSLFGQHLSFNVVADSLNSRFGLTFSGSMLRLHSRSGTMGRALYDHLVSTVKNDSRPICTVLFNVVKDKGLLDADLATCMRLVLELDYVQAQVGKTFIDQVWFRTQQVLRLSSVKQAKEFVGAYMIFTLRCALEEQLMPLMGNYLSRVQSSGLPSGHWI